MIVTRADAMGEFKTEATSHPVGGHSITEDFDHAMPVKQSADGFAG